MAAKIKAFRFAAKVWKRRHRFIPLHDNDCRFIIDLVDFFEESRNLSSQEAALRDDARAELALSIRKQAAHWKQRGKFRAIKECDENTRFFHAMASSKLRRNHIRALDIDGVQVVSHEAKATVLYEFYTSLLGRAREPSWSFELGDLYAAAAQVDGPALTACFSEAEIKVALQGIDRASAPGPDGLGPSFYRAAWGTVAPDLVRLFDGFHAGEVNLSSINRAHIVLLPKKDGVLAPGAYRPVSLQNCNMKLVCKALTSRLQAQISSLIDADQSGFIAGRSISENFVYATEIVVQCCHKRKAPAFALKLDFAKAFDSIEWRSLRQIMLCRGFLPRFCDWMDAIFASSRSAVVLNGIPGRWIECRRGLRQGDPLSPYLFLLVADVLQKLIQQDDVLEHPLVNGAPPVVL
jgi:hypothetical protein